MPSDQSLDHQPILTLGIDLAADPKKTACCQIEWNPAAATVRLLTGPPGVGLSDEYLVECIRAADKSGIDAPLGWPRPFVDALTAHSTMETWPGLAAVDQKATEEFRKTLKFRQTDLEVTSILGRPPLSVSADMIGVVAMRAARILALAAADGQRIDRSGREGKVAEVYPAVALHQWLPSADPLVVDKGRKVAPYKGKNRAEGLPKLFDAFTAECDWLDWEDATRDKCRTNDDAFDAVICALVARAVMTETTIPIPDNMNTIAREEGWIHIPDVGRRLDHLLQ